MTDNNITNNLEAKIEKEDDKPKVKKQYQTFKQLYDSNPEFRKRHLEKMKQEAQCECGVSLKRSHLGRHRKSKKHLKAIGFTKATELRAAMEKFMESYMKENLIKIPDINEA